MTRGGAAWRKHVLAPGLFYLAAYVALTFPAIRHFGSAFFADAIDGLQNVWNLWWVDWAVRHGTSPWYTTFLHFPQGTSLVAHTLNPFNGFLGIPLRTVLNTAQTYNTIVVFSFVMGGLTAYWLSLELTGDRGASLLCGYVFTFSEFHFAHAQGHLQLVALEWLPLFLLAFWRLLRRPSPTRGVLAAGSLFLVLLCDYYYFVFSVLAGAILLGGHLVSQRREHPWAERRSVLSLAAFVSAGAALCGPLVFSLLHLSVHDRLIGAHDPNEYSLDLLGPLIHGGTWRFSEWTRWYWQRLPGNPSESSVCWGLGAIVLMIVAWTTSGRTERQWIGIWSFLLAFFVLLALGPRLRLLGQPLGHIPGPFGLLVRLVPPLKLAGTPVRMSVMASLCVGLLAGVGFSILWRGSRWARGLAMLLLCLVVLESWPMRQTLTRASFPAYVAALRALPRGYGLFDVDDALGSPRALYEQTGHQIPIPHGYISRVPESVAERDAALDALVALGQWQFLCERYGFRYFAFGPDTAADPTLASAAMLVGADDRRRFYDLGRKWSCAREPRGPFPVPDLPLPWQAVERRDPSDQRARAMCTVDSVNFRDPRQGRRPIELARSLAINVVGWAFEPDGRGAPPSVRLRLERPDGTGYEAPARRVSRPDVAEYFKDASLEMAGFQIFGRLITLPADSYRLTIVQEDEKGRTFCDSGVELRLF